MICIQKLLIITHNYKRMRQHVLSTRTILTLPRLQRRFIANAETNNSFLLAKTLFVWLKENIQYQTHPNDEGVRPAAVTLHNKVGDCDDLSFLYVSLCRVLGIPARFIRGYLLTGYDNGTAIATAHAWVEVFVGGSVGHNGWIPVECACCTDVH